MLSVFVEKPNGDIYNCIIIKHKNNGKYSFVNLSKEHICPCQFDTEKDAIDDLYKRKESGLIVDFSITNCNTVKFTSLEQVKEEYE